MEVGGGADVVEIAVADVDAIGLAEATWIGVMEAGVVFAFTPAGEMGIAGVVLILAGAFIVVADAFAGVVTGTLGVGTCPLAAGTAPLAGVFTANVEVDGVVAAAVPVVAAGVLGAVG